MAARSQCQAAAGHRSSGLVRPSGKRKEAAHRRRGCAGPVLTRLATAPPALRPRRGAGADVGPGLWRRPRARAMNQLRGKCPGAGVTGRRRGGGLWGGPRGSTVAISRLAERFWHSWDPQEFASWSHGRCRGNDPDPATRAVPGTRRAGRVGREVGEA